MTPAEKICFALYSATHAMQRVYQPMLAPLGLTYPQYLVMSCLWDQDGRTVGDLGRMLELESNTLTPLLKRMEAQGLLTRARSTTDERQVQITLTDKGRALQDEVDPISRCFFEACGLPMQDLTDLRDQITGLRDRLAKS